MIVLFGISYSMILTIFTSNDFSATPENTNNNGESSRMLSSNSNTNKIKRVFVNFAFCQTSDDRLENLKFFLRNGVTLPHLDSGLTEVHYGLVVNGECTDPACNSGKVGSVPLRIIHRENTGFDFGQHTAMLEDLEQDGLLSYDAYVFLNAGVTGPFVPSYLPQEWHWVRGFTDKLVNNVGVVGTSIVCLPAEDLGGFGPKVEGFAFAMSAESLRIVRKYGTSFRQHRNKTAAILDGEYALSKTIFDHRMTIDSLLFAYKGVVWEPQMACNNLRHPSRHGAYFGMQMHPFETLFHKERWAKELPVLGTKPFRTYNEFVGGKHLPTKENVV